LWCWSLTENHKKTKKKRRKRKKPEVELKVSLGKEQYFLYKGPARHVKFVVVIFVLGIVNLIAEFKTSVFPENLAALFMCLIIISIVALILLRHR